MIYLITKKKVLFEDNNIKYDLKIKDVKEHLKDEEIISLDTETDGLDPLVNKIIMLQLGTKKGNQYIIDCRDYNINKLKNILEDTNKVFVGHNIKYDYNMLKSKDIILRKVYDTMLSDNVIYNGYYSRDYIKTHKRFSLAGVVKHHLNIGLRKDIREDIMYIGSKSFKYDHVIYGARDVIYPLKVMDKQINLLNKFNLVKCAKLENKVTLALGDIEYNGFYLNKDKWKEISKEYRKKLNKTINDLDTLVINNPKGKIYKKNYYQKDLFDENFEDKRFTTINWSSDQQVYKILSEVFDIHPTDKHGKPSASAKAIQYLNDKYEITDLILRYREEHKVLTSFGLDFINKYIKSDGRVHTNFKQIVETGRVSSNKPNLQQIPSTELFRNCFEAPKNKKIITADYSNQEGRIMADQANDNQYINFFNNGDGDAHSFVATKMFSAAFGKEFIVTKYNENKEYRQKGKTINFAISYGGSAFSLSKDLKIPLNEAEELIENFYKGFPKLKEYFDSNWNFGLKNGYIYMNDVMYRRRWFNEYNDYLNYKEISKQRDASPDYFKRYKKLEGEIGRKSMNNPIQGTAGDMTKQALINIREKLLENGILPEKNSKVKLVSVVHDECSIESPKDEAEYWANIQKEAMKDAANMFVSKVEIPVDQEIADHWTH